MIDTTMNVHVNIFEEIRKIAEKADMSISRAIAMLLKRAMADNNFLYRTGSTTRYQDRDKKP